MCKLRLFVEQKIVNYTTRAERLFCATFSRAENGKLIFSLFDRTYAMSKNVVVIYIIGKPFCVCIDYVLQILTDE